MHHREGSEVQFDARIAVRIYLNVAGELNAALRSARVLPVRRWSAGRRCPELTVKYLVNSSGSLRLGSTENVAIAGPFGLAS